MTRARAQLKTNARKLRVMRGEGSQVEPAQLRIHEKLRRRASRSNGKR